MMRRRAFTLLELILVMAILSSIFAITAPSMARFFRGQTLEEEARRMVMMLRYAPDLAISTGIPRVFRLDEANGIYGVLPQAGYVEAEEEELVFRIDENHEVSVLSTRMSTPGDVQITFQPDGSILETSLPVIRLQRQDETIDIGKAPYGREFKILNDQEKLRYGIQ